MEALSIPGMQVVITRAGEVAYSGRFGYADLAHRVPVTDSTRFQTGSIGKTATALGIALLERRGALSLDDPLTDFFPGAPPAWSEITVRHLLDQTSGLHDPELGWTEEFTEEEYLQAAFARPPAFAPGQYHVYLNVNYALAGMITHRVSGVSWQEFQEEEVFAPLGMNRTVPVVNRVIVPNGASGYQLEAGRLLYAAPRFSQAVWDLASGSLWTTARDWTELLLGYHRDGLFDADYVNDVLLTSRPLLNGDPVNYSFGQRTGSINGHRTLEHGGGTPGFRSFGIVFPDDDITLMVLANLSFDIQTLAHTLAGLFEPDLRVPERTEVAMNDLERFEGQYHFPSWGDTEFVVEGGRLFLQAEWFRNECRMVGPTTCSPEGETRFEFVAGEDGVVEAVIYRDSAYDPGWRLDRIRGRR